MDVKGISVDVKGTYVDVKGISVDGKGTYVDVKGISVDVKGTYVDVKGIGVDVKNIGVDVKGIGVDVKGIHTSRAQVEGDALAAAGPPQRLEPAARKHDQSDAGSVGIFSQSTNRTQESRVYSHDGG
eukprot:1178953-Prorocentrum_minimum.AAC.1